MISPNIYIYIYIYIYMCVCVTVYTLSVYILIYRLLVIVSGLSRCSHDRSTKPVAP